MNILYRKTNKQTYSTCTVLYRRLMNEHLLYRKIKNTNIVLEKKEKTDTQTYCTLQKN